MAEARNSKTKRNDSTAVMTWINRGFPIKVFLLLGLIGSGIFVFIYYDLFVDFVHKERAIAFIKSFHPYDQLVFISLQILRVVVSASCSCTDTRRTHWHHWRLPLWSFPWHNLSMNQGRGLWFMDRLCSLPGCLACPWWKRP